MAMNGRHLPAGQMPPDGGRRRQQQYNQNQHQHPHYPSAQAAYNPYLMNPYNPPFYPQQYHPQQYQQHQGMPPQYVQQYAPYVRSPPPQMHHYAPPPHMSQQQAPSQSYPPRPQQSPAIATSYQGPPPTIPQAPSSVHSQSSYSVAAPVTPTTPQVAVSVAASVVTVSPIVEERPRPPFKAPLPWFSNPDDSWPARRPRRKRKSAPQASSDAVQLPEIQPSSPAEESTPTDVAIPRPETPSTNPQASEAAEEAASTNPTTPSSQNVVPTQGGKTPVAPKASQRPAIPIVPAVPKALPREANKPVEKAVEAPVAEVKQVENGHDEGLKDFAEVEEVVKEEETPVVEAPKAWSKPKQWAGLFSKPGVPASSTSEPDRTNPAVAQTNAESLAEALNKFNAESKEAKVAFLEPRGLVNTGNMCYMNSVLQVLVFCSPFYNFLDQVSKKAAHSFKSDTPLIDAMIMFMREFPIIDSAVSVEKLNLRLKEGELEQYGQAFTPNFVYEVINKLPRFSSMRRGHQQDAEEFLGFLLEGLHDECVRVIKNNTSNNASALATPTNGPASPTDSAFSVTKDELDWQEVGPKQRASVSRSIDKDGSPITKIFGGKLRSEFRVPGLKDSVTYEPYQPLQLDIGDPGVNNIIDALKALTRPETIHGDFKSPKGPNLTAVKQVFIEDVPPVLILHLKRFQYDNAGGTQKIWKKVGYPLELELPKEVFSRKKRGDLNLANAFPRYRLIAVVYHHGKNASGGHYTVDVRRQDGREWIRLDDTVIRRVRSSDVAQAGSEEDPKVLAAINGAKSESPSLNPFAAIDEEAEKEEDGEGWKQASGPGKKWSAVANGAPATKSKAEKFSVKDNKVAYMLFYQKI